MEAYSLDPNRIRDISPLLLDDKKRLRVVPSAVFERTTPEERLLFGVRHGLYSFPTEELCAYLLERIQGRSAIEIGAGHGVLSGALSIRATDNRQQEQPELGQRYQEMGQPTVPYGANVERLDAVAAVKKYKPSVVISCWVTHRFDPDRPHAGGNPTGVDEAAIIDLCDEYISVGNEHVHAPKPIWALPHEKLNPPWIYSRAVNGSKDYVAIWRRSGASKA